jgi:hypothetical protein
MGSVIVTLDSVDVTDQCVAGSWTRRLNRPSVAQIRMPMQSAAADVGAPLKIEALVGTSYEIVHHGRVLLCETDTGEDTGYTVYNSTDPMELWNWRPVRDNDCDFSDPQIITEYLTGPAIIEAALNNSIDCGGGGPDDCEGDLFLTINAAASGGVDLTGAPTDWPMTIAELASLLVSTGEVDVVITPTDPGGGIMGEVDFYNGDYGTDLSSTIVFSYGTGDFNVRRLRWNQDMTTMVNKLWYYGGPKIATAADPAAVQHWCFNVTGDDPAFNPDGFGAGAWATFTSYFEQYVVTNGGTSFICIQDNTSAASNEPGVGVDWQQYWTVLMVPPGGRNSPPASSGNNQLGALRISSQAAYGVRMDIQIFDAYDACAGVGTVGRDLFRKRWQQESWLRAQPREIIHVTPTRETEIGTFDIGDRVGVEAVAAVRGGFSGVQRVYEYTVSWDNDGVLELSELQTSADNEGL